MFRRIIGAALVLMAAAGLTVVASAPASAASPRYFWMWGNERIVDYESFGSNEVCNRQVNTGRRLVTESAPVSLLIVETCGGEIRTEWQTVVYLGENNSLRIFGTVRFYEGSSESTSDLDGIRWVNVTIPPTQPFGYTPLNVTVRNDAEGDCDCAYYTLRVTNHAS